MPIEIRRFGVGHRRPDGPPGTTGVTGQVVHSDARGLISELAFARGARIEPHANPNTTWLVVIEGGRILEQGPHDQLLAGRGQYAALWQHQSGGFLQEVVTEAAVASRSRRC